MCMGAGGGMHTSWEGRNEVHDKSYTGPCKPDLGSKSMEIVDVHGGGMHTFSTPYREYFK